MEIAVGLDGVERVGAKRRISDIQDSCGAMTRKIPGTVSGAFEMASELVHRKTFIDAAQSTELVL